MENPTVGYSLGVLEGYLESLAKDNQVGAEECLGYLKIVENAYVEKASQLAAAEKKLANISLNLQGWSQN
jgi:hypothetical protein